MELNSYSRFKILKPETSGLRINNLRQILLSSNKPISNAKGFFRLRENASFEGIKIKSKIKNSQKKLVIDELLFINSLFNAKKLKNEKKEEKCLPKFETKALSKSLWVNEKTSTRKIISHSSMMTTNSLLLANNNDAGVLRIKDELFLGNKKNKFRSYFKSFQLDMTEKSLINEKNLKYLDIPKNLKESTIAKNEKYKMGKLCVNKFNSILSTKPKISIKDLKEDLIIYKKTPIIFGN